MLSQLPAAGALALLHAELGAPPVTILESGAGPRTLRAAVAEAAADPEGGLLALLAADGRAAMMARTWLKCVLCMEPDYHVIGCMDQQALYTATASC